MYRFSNIYVLAAFGTIGGALFGFDVSSMRGITASMSAGSSLGAIGAGFLADALGRRIALQIACVIFIIGCAIVCSAQNVGQPIAGRVINGLAIGICSSQVVVYLAELAPGKIRGRIIGIQQWSIKWGILIMYLICYGCASTVSGPAAFRIAWGVQATPALILAVALVSFPESPRWLAAQERWEEFLDILAATHANGDRSSPIVLAEYEEVREAQRIAAEAKGIAFTQLFGPKIWKRTLAGTTVQMWQQLLGGNVAMYYVVYIFEMAGLSGNVNLYSSAIQHVIFLVTTGVMLPIIDRIGRRRLLLVGSVICMALHFSTAGVMATYGKPVPEVLGNANLRLELTGVPGKAVIALSYMFTGVYGLTWAPTGWIYAGEVFPLKYRAKGVGLSAATNWIFNFALAFFLPPAFKNITWKTYIIFGVFCTVMTIHIFFTCPETARKTLEEIDVLSDSKVKPWGSSKVQLGAFEARVEKVEDIEAAENASGVSKKEEVDVNRETI